MLTAPCGDQASSLAKAALKEQLSLFPKILQRGVAQLLLAAQVLDAADEPGLDPLRRLLALWRRPGRRPGMLLDTLPQPFRMARFAVMKAEPKYLPVPRSAIRAKLARRSR